MEFKSILFDNQQVSYKIEGDGVAIVFVHGFGEDSSIWRNQEGIFKANKSIFLDLPGSGKSSFNAKLDSIEAYAKLVNAIVEAENISKCILIGHSMGGYIALAFAKLFPEKLISLMLFHSSAYADSEEKIIGRKKSIEFVNNNSAAAYFKTMIPDLFYNKELHKEMTRQQIEYVKSISDETTMQYLKIMMDRADNTQVLKTLSIPFAFILGEHDKAVPFNQGLEQTHLTDTTYVYILRESAHMGMLEETDKVNISLIEFVKSSAN